jgi:hypothetical protein
MDHAKDDPAAAYRGGFPGQRQDGAQYRVRQVRGAGGIRERLVRQCQYSGRLRVVPGFQPPRIRCRTSRAARRPTCSNPFPADSNALQLPIAKTLGPTPNVGNASNWPDQNYRAQINDRVNFTLMQEVPGQFKVDATWFMNIGTHVGTTCR